MDIIVKNRVLEKPNVNVIGDNADYTVNFTFDEEWLGKTKTARFSRKNGQYVDVVLTDDACTIPVEILKSGFISIGVFSQNMTTAPIDIYVTASIKDKTGNPVQPNIDVYSQLLQRIDEISTGGMSQTAIRSIIETQVQSYIIENGISVDEDTVADAVADYITNHPVSGGASVDETQVNTLISTFFNAHKEELKGEKGDTGASGTGGTITDEQITQVTNRVSEAVANTVDNPFVTAYWKDSTTNKLYLVKIVNGVLTVTEQGSNGSGGDIPPIDDIPTDTLLTGKTFWFVGDSITYGDGTKAPYECILNETTGLVETNKGYSSSTISDYVNKSPMVNRVSSYKNMDSVVIFGGTNDFEFHVPIGETYSEENVLNVDSKTFKGALNKMIDTLKSNAQNIYFMTPIHRNPTNTSLLKETATNDAGHTFVDYVNAIKEICGLHNVTVFDAYNECNLNPNNESDNSNYFADGLHLNIYGHKKLASYVANKLGVAMSEYVITDTIALNKSSISISSPLQLVATVSPKGNNVVYSSYNEDVATVDSNGKITPRKNGSTIIIANSEGKIAKCEVTVTGQSENSSVVMPSLGSFNHFCIAYDENATDSTKKYVLVATNGEGINFFYYSSWNCVAYDFSSNADSTGYAWYSEDGKTWSNKQNLGGSCRIGISHTQTSKIINASNDIYSQRKKAYDVAARESNSIASF